MLDCEFCRSNPISSSLTRCCKSLICSSCRERLDKKMICSCGRPLQTGKKSCNQSPQILELLQKISEGKVKQCDRCQSQADVQCTQCEMIYCNTCNLQVHAAIGFAKHDRKKYVQTKQNLQKMRKKQALCGIHSQIIFMGCECGAGLCAVCVKQHRQICQKGGKMKPLKEFKEQYYLNVLLKVHQVAQFKEKLTLDKSKFTDHFKNQQQAFQANQKLIKEQFQYITKMIQIKYSQVKTRLGQYWNNCEHVYHQNISKINQQLKRFDQIGQLIPKFAQNLINLDFFDKKIKRYFVNMQFINVKTVNVDQVQSSILGISMIEKPWEGINSDTNFNQNLQTKPNVRDDARLFGNIQNAAELLLDYTHNPLKDRQLYLLPSHNEIYFSFIHLPYQHLKYELEYGVGMKIKGQQIFKKITNLNGYGTIEGMNSSTKYRVRMRVVEGQWGTINQISTLEVPKFNLQSSLFAKAMGQNGIQIIKGGAVYGSNQINFGVHKWVIKLTSKSISYEDSETACMSVGVSNKQTKKATFVGTTLNYGYQKSQIILKIILDCNEKRMTISNSTNNQQQVYQNLPNLPLFPTIQNKGNGQVLVKYNLTTDDSNLC